MSTVMSESEGSTLSRSVSRSAFGHPASVCHVLQENLMSEALDARFPHVPSVAVPGEDAIETEIAP